MGVTEFPPRVNCERCGTPMRPATREELRADAIDPRYRHVALQAAQGDRDFEPEDEDPLGRALAGDLTERPTGLMRCDSCGLRLLWNRLEEP